MRVRGAGPCPCDIAIIGPYPGWKEDATGIPFCPSHSERGNVGDELDRFLDGDALPTRDAVYLDNLHQFYMGRDYVYTLTEHEEAYPALLDRLARIHPTTIVTFGREVSRLFLGDVDITDVEGIPWIDPADSSRVIFPLVHIAAGMRNSDLACYVVSGFKALAAYLCGELQPRALFDDPFPETHYEEITTIARLEQTLHGLAEGQSLATDTEGWPGNPWSVQYSLEPGTGYLIRATAQELLVRFGDIIRRVRPTLVFHSALHDLGMFRALDIHIDGLTFDDSMVAAYLLQLEPQGLKAACLRHCNMKMMSYDDVIGDTANDLARDYLTWIWDSEQVEYEEKQQAEFERRRTEVWTDARGKTRVGRKITKLPELPKTPLHKAVTRVLQSTRPRGLWEDQIEDIHVAAYHRLGPLPQATLDYVEPSIAIPYGCRDADGTARLLPEYSKRIDALGLREVYNLELSTYPLIDRMQRIGLKPDLDHFKDLSDILGWEIQQLRTTLESSTQRPDFNANSGDQVADYLFGALGLEEVKMTRSGRGSTNDKILEALEHEHPEHEVISTIREYREVYKLKNTFCDRLPDFVNRWPHDGRVHATFRTTRVVTGRLAASDPNVLAQPEHGKFAPEFKRGWVADDGHVLCAWDESQVELRGLAHLSQDPVLLAVYRGELRNPDGTLIDLHAKLAQRIFGGKVEQYMHKCAERLAAKAVNFGIPMGMTNRGLSVELRKNGVDADEDTAQRWLDDTLRLYTGVARYMEERKDEARCTGFVRCLSGRIRYIGGIRSRDDRVREEAERFAFSTPIQESASWIMKRAEAVVWEDVLPYFWKQKYWVEPILQVHDCLKLEADEAIKDELNTLMVEAMTTAVNGFSVPLAVEGEWGYTMGDTVPFV